MSWIIHHTLSAIARPVSSVRTDPSSGQEQHVISTTPRSAKQQTRTSFYVCLAGRGPTRRRLSVFSKASSRTRRSTAQHSSTCMYLAVCPGPAGTRSAAIARHARNPKGPRHQGSTVSSLAVGDMGFPGRLLLALEPALVGVWSINKSPVTDGVGNGKWFERETAGRWPRVYLLAPFFFLSELSKGKLSSFGSPSLFSSSKRATDVPTAVPSDVPPNNAQR